MEGPAEYADALLADNLAEARKMVPRVEEAYRKCRSKYATDPSARPGLRACSTLATP
jgi:hypothetical protein